VALALVVANEDRAGFEVTPWSRNLSCQALQERPAFAIEAAESPLLDAAGDHASEQVLAQSGRRRSSKDRPPVPPESIEGQRSQARDLGRDRGRLCRVPPHGQARGCAVAVSDDGILPATIR
jgi:hypothetical protein